MTEAEIETILADVVHRVAPEIDLTHVAPDDDLRQALDLDSFDFLNVLIGLQERLGLEIPERDYGKVRSLRSLVTYCKAAQR
ncbi:MAG TPA: acyl carrier protein [Candidatus Limnocylindria bacterium]|jgi:acyl carrier protein|nr:acyl carrier protein [Candidatus Limnocylindria bacterium]